MSQSPEKWSDEELRDQVGQVSNFERACVSVGSVNILDFLLRRAATLISRKHV